MLVDRPVPPINLVLATILQIDACSRHGRTEYLTLCTPCKWFRSGAGCRPKCRGSGGQGGQEAWEVRHEAGVKRKGGRGVSQTMLDAWTGDIDSMYSSLKSTWRRDSLIPP